MEKRAVSPVIAMVLLIALAVSISAMVIIWSTSYTRDTTEYVESRSAIHQICSMDTGLEFWQTVDKDDDLCYSTGSSETYITFKLMNTGTTPVTGLLVTVIDGSNQGISIPINKSTVNKTQLSRVIFPLEQPGYIASFNVTVLNTTDKPKQIRIFPMITYSSQTVVCTEIYLNEYILSPCT